MIYLLFKSALDSVAFLQLRKFTSKEGVQGEKLWQKKKHAPKKFDVENLCNYTKDWPVRVTLLTAGLPRTQIQIPSCPSCHMNSEAEAVVLTNPGSHCRQVPHLQLETSTDDATAADLSDSPTPNLK